MRAKFSQLLVCVFSVLVCLCYSASAYALSWDLEMEHSVPPNTTADIVITFTKDNNIIGSQVRQIINGTNNTIKKTVKATAPADTNDRDYESTYSPLAAVAASTIPDGLFADYGDFLFANGFIGLGAALESPMVIADLNVNDIFDAGDDSIFALINDIDAFSLVADESNFPIETTLATDANGQVSGLLGITFYTDSTHTTPYANNQLFVTGISREFVIPEPSTMLLLGSGLIGLAGISRKKFKK